MVMNISNVACTMLPGKIGLMAMPCMHMQAVLYVPKALLLAAFCTTGWAVVQVKN